MKPITDFLGFLIPEYLFDLLPVFGMVLCLAGTFAMVSRKREYRWQYRALGIAAVFVLLLSTALEVLQPIMQIYLEEDLEIIFLEANKVTGMMRNLRYLLYPVGMFILGYAIFDDRFEEGWDQ
ncbi:MAG: hypothetical protein HPY85_00140 [Anaerolineae bacterium]|nr:hypothetical protein [Anaerolineae bacterium]